MPRARAAIVVVLLLLAFACKRTRANKNDDIAACQATGGQWVEGCNDSGRCEKTTGIAPDDEDDEAEEDESD
jgi:hypothetical protein